MSDFKVTKSIFTLNILLHMNGKNLELQGQAALNLHACHSCLLHYNLC